MRPHDDGSAMPEVRAEDILKFEQSLAKTERIARERLSAPGSRGRGGYIEIADKQLRKESGKAKRQRHLPQFQGIQKAFFLDVFTARGHSLAGGDGSALFWRIS